MATDHNTALALQKEEFTLIMIATLDGTTWKKIENVAKIGAITLPMFFMFKKRWRKEEKQDHHAVRYVRTPPLPTDRGKYFSSTKQ